MCHGTLSTTLSTIFEKYDFQSRPEAIYNVDEKGINQAHLAPKVVGSRDWFSRHSLYLLALGCIATCLRAVAQEVIGRCPNLDGQMA